MILNMDLMRPEDYEIDVILNFFIPYVLSNGRMKKIRARNPWVFAALIEICEYCGIELVKTSLGKVDGQDGVKESTRWIRLEQGGLSGAF